MKNLYYLLLVSLILVHSPLWGQPFTGGYSFLIPSDDSTTSPYLPTFPKQAITAHVSAVGDHFEVNGQPIRFWGVNFTAHANFPSHSQADFLVGRMRKMGINLVRFHHMDNNWTGTGGNIFQSGSTLNIDTSTLDKLHYLIAKMKEEGIYANINLLVTRGFSEADGIPDIDSIPDPFKLISMFDGQMIQLQKDYASQLLGTNNPYTNMPLAEDPVVAMVEINNENTIYGYWRQDDLQIMANGGKLLKRHADTLDLKWNQFLEDKYGTDQALAAAWAASSGGSNPELVTDGDFELNDISQNWALEQHNGATGTLSTTTTNPFAGTYSARVDVTNSTGTDWHIQFKQAGLSVQAGKTYQLSFAARADQPMSYWVSVMNDVSPYNDYGGSVIDVTSTWQVFNIYFTPNENNAGNCRISFSLGANTNVHYFDNVSMKEFVPGGLGPDESLTDNSVRRIRYSERLAFVPQRAADMAEFYIKLQEDYYTTMANYLRNTLNVQAPITGSNALGGIYEIRSATALDYIDEHAYWDHPQFPNNPWDPADWFINNTPMLQENFLGTIPELFGGYALNDKPYTVSEYNHASPNIYQVEMMPIIASYGLFNGMDGLEFFEYSAEPADGWTADKVSGFFAIRANPAVMSLMPVFAKVFRDGLIAEDNNPALAQYNDDYIFNMPQIDDHENRWWSFFPYDNNGTLVQSIRTGSLNAPAVSLPAVTLSGPPYVTQTNEIEFNPNKKLLHVGASKIASYAGLLSNAGNMPDNALTVSNASGFGVIAWISLTNSDLVNSDRSLLAMSSRFQNTGMTWNATNTSVNDNWGSAPTEMLPLSAQFQLHINADSIRLYPLNGTGQPVDSIKLTSTNGIFNFTFDQNTWPTPWMSIKKLYAPLPVTYIEKLQARRKDEKVLLKWVTGEEVNNDYFEILHSKDAKTWASLGRLAAKEKGSGEYFFWDKHPFPGANYYRLKQWDLGGNFSFSNIATAYLPTHDVSLIPLGDKQYRLDGLNAGTPVRFEVLDMMGRQVLTGNAAQGILDASSLPEGIYLARIFVKNLPAVGVKFIVSE